MLKSLSLWNLVSVLGCLLWLSGCEESDSSETRPADSAVDDASTPDADVDAEPVLSLPTARFELASDPALTPLAHVPWPSDLYRNAQGRLDLRAFQRPEGSLLDLVIDALELETPGFGTSANLYLSTDSPLDPALLPADGAASIKPDSSLILVDVDPDSAEYGTRLPLRWRQGVAATRFLPEHALSIRLVEGFALRPATTYALILTTAAAKPSPAFLETLSPDESPDAAWRLHAPLRAWLAESGVTPAVASVFTTQDPVSELFRLRDFLWTQDAPVATAVTSRGIQQGRPDDFELFNGKYIAPRFQEGEIPYRERGQGAIRFNEAGEPIIQGEEELRFALSVPLTPPPEEGWPVVLYAHGTGGDYMSFVREDVAANLTKDGLAVLSMDQIHHGPRSAGACDAGDDACVSLLFFNVNVPTAARDNVRQAAIDLVSLLRMAQGLRIEASETRGGQAVKLDPARIAFMGHSQGGLNGPLFLAVEPSVRGAVFSGAGSNIAISVEQKTEPYDINRLVSLALGLPAGEPLDRFHPALMLLQTFIEPGDAVNYARFWFDEPAPNYPPRSVFMTSGLADPYTPPDATSALAAAARMPIVGQVHQPIEALTLLGIEAPGVPPFSGNVADGQASAGVAQFPGQGHYVVFDDLSARRRCGSFLADVLTRAVPRVF